MANIKTKILTDQEYELIITTIRGGFTTKDGKQIKPNPRIATILTIMANLGLRIGDVMKLRLSDIIRDGNRYRLDIKEEKTGKSREFTVPSEVFTFIQGYALEQGIRPNQRLFPITVRAVQKHLHCTTTQYLKLSGVSTHSFRKYFATSIYQDNNYNIELVRTLLQHSNSSITQRYLGVQLPEIEQALQKHIKLPS
ncbi:tyrosine-type recombinase/integrase [Anaeromicrobium sp.]|jgi:integrase|uniref:tyrosine-type recombinase/integrase n=1 Tax=Anaeromicrobium sp. TaxID=1929132 RepID=UPI0025DF2F05|nr:tyrosine-type recombinase/integrase [Anaeromicrobium sp.]